MDRQNREINPLASLEGWLRGLVREEVHTVMANGGNPAPAGEALKPYLTIKEAATYSRLGVSTIRLAIRKRQLKAHQVGSRVIVKRADLESYLEGHPIEILPE